MRIEDMITQILQQLLPTTIIMRKRMGTTNENLNFDITI